ncbi:efflux RND transporter permease subunit [Acidithiobacillus ferrooxidans]|uniref:AcrB/AcrD/AcrF family protein n=1 Tax=Acidithiobacillus ferrooxidans TaxID=920 RepID=A0A2W1K5N8_ACIFR|nr:efflux RND transporter permease subunit [Acidithiobacillus ferrooxidans]MCR1343969.1 efflux RND transporter permease subunit [Acidithiobacillus ferrooxidans]PZD82059.1 AcrB/AcrD/AcrF family protein [Acidithiobacillus ferrooxidans]QLK41656.1 efflux RND transporter permease subunit [Acidithiobacillus ferrooxidans]QZT53600.1 efflux RND transporter permease subunit [Acidithiobacillus ferrooxidans]BDB13761.1 cation efflux system protein [Acidithiobacillus ferrooxidans]
MLKAIIRFSIRFRGVIIALAFLLVGYGLYTLSQVKLDAFPSFTPPLVTVATEAPGLSPEQVATLVTQPIENTLSGTLGLQSMRSRSIQGLSVITLTFHNGTNIYRDRQIVAERLNAVAGQLPLGVRAPFLTPLTSATGVVQVLGLTSDTRSLMTLRTLADWLLKPQLLSIPGVANVAIYGGQVRELQIQVEPGKLVRFGLSFQDIIRAAQRATGVRGAGFLEDTNQRIAIRTEGQSITAPQLANMIILRRQGADLRLGDVAHVVAAPAPAIGGATIGGKQGVILNIEEQYGANTLAVTRALKDRLQQLGPVLAAQGVSLHPDLFRQASYIETAIAHLRGALLLGAVLVIAVLFLFLFNVRTALISAIAIPLSLLTAIIVLNALGASINTMTLGGLAVAIGEVADDAIIDVENIFRRLRENRNRVQSSSIAKVVFSSSWEVRGAVTYATFIVALVFLPVLSLSGVAGKLFAPLGEAYIAAVFASLGVALTVTPALAYLLLGRTPSRSLEHAWIRKVKAAQARLLTTTEGHSRWLIVGITLLFLTAIVVLHSFGNNFLPEFRERHFIVHVSTEPGTSLAESLRLGRHISLALGRIPAVRSVAQRVGRAERTGTDTYGVNVSEFIVGLKPLSGDAQEHVLTRIRKTLSEFPGVSFSVETPLSDRIEETISGYTAPVIVSVFGSNFDVLYEKAREIAAVLEQLPGAVDVQMHAPPSAPQLTIRLRETALARWGFEPVGVLDAIQTAYAGTTVAQTYQGNRVFNVVVTLDPAERQNPVQVGNLPLRNPNGWIVPLRDLADIHESFGPYAILETAGQPVQTVTTNVQGRALSSFVQEAERRIHAEVRFSPGTYVVFSGAAEAQAKAQRELLMHALMAGVGIVLLLFIALRRTRALFLVLLNLPFALIGGVAAVLFTSGVLSLGSLVGFVTIFGISLRNSIMLISHYQHLVEVEGMSWGREAAIRGAQERLVPILMTALVTALGLLPLALASGAPGNEIEGPMAQVILGGLITSTALNLLVLPTMALRFGRFGYAAGR